MAVGKHEGVHCGSFGQSEVVLQEEQVGRLLDMRNDQVHGHVQTLIKGQTKRILVQ